MQIHLLDVGSQKYGDAILVVDGDIRMLIDGAHVVDIRPHDGNPSIPDQLARILGGGHPFDLSLLVVTHCHSDHIGCLPELVGQNIIRPQRALVAEPNLGYGIARDGTDALQFLDAPTRRVVAALRQESLGADATDAEIRQLIADSADEERRYRGMIEKLRSDGCQVTEYLGPSQETRSLESAFASSGFKILGPTADHLVICADAIATSLSDAIDALDRMRAQGRDAGETDLYRMLTARGRDAGADFDAGLDSEGNRPGAAVNNQSIVIALKAGAHTALLTGDMQFSRPNVGSLSSHMRGLLDSIAAAGPYSLVKLPHHAAANGFSETIMEIFDDTTVYGISTGRNGSDHPNPGILRLLDSNRDRVDWARTDRNGAVTFDLSGPQIAIEVSEGETDDAVPKTSDVIGAETQSAGLETSETPTRSLPGASTGSFVSITAQIPDHLARVTITVDIEPRRQAYVAPRPPTPSTPSVKPQKPIEDRPRRFAGGRTTPLLAFLTDARRLESKLGAGAVRTIEKLVTDAGHRYVGGGATVPLPANLRAGLRDAGGVVILGGYDVLPALRYDVLPPALRAQVRANDPDRFVVWSDQTYGDVDGDGLADIPVSRIPDGGPADIIMRCLAGAGAAKLTHRFGIRNAERPFAELVFNGDLPGSGNLRVSAPWTASAGTDPDAAGANVYFMLHGSDSDCTRFWGEDAELGAVEAFNTGNVPELDGAVVLSGCCWGALSVDQIASRYRQGNTITPLSPRQSIALTCLALGARAFVGCTGAHYSPLEGNMNYFGRPIHSSFWQRIGRGEAPAQALFGAKKDYIDGMPHGRNSIEEVAIEYKILRQFTCLGLGW